MSKRAAVIDGQWTNVCLLGPRVPRHFHAVGVSARPKLFATYRTQFRTIAASRRGHYLPPSLSVLFVIMLACIPTISASSSFVGCYLDETKVTKRSLPYVQEISPDMTAKKCSDLCSSLGFAVAGLEYAEECYCGREVPPVEIAAKKCSTPCAGDPSVMCGGPYALSIYKHDGPLMAPVDPRPLLALVMIIKNEAHTIIDTLKTVRHVIDRWYILDTGSTDGTQKIIQDYLKDVPGKLFEEPFVDYGATRNRILDLCNQTEKVVFTLMLSADEQVKNPEEMRKFLEDVRFARGRQHNAYPVLMNSGIEFDSVRISRQSGNWRYQGRVHEYLTSPENKWVDLYRPVPETRVLFKATDEDRRFKSQYFIIKVLQEDLVKNPNDTRALFYLGRTFDTVGNHTSSFQHYTWLAERSKWTEEVYHARVMAAEQAKKLKYPWQDRQNMLLEAFVSKPHDMDAIHMLAEDHYNENRFQLAYIFALRAAQLKQPENMASTRSVLLRDTEHLYKWEGNRLLGFAAEKVSEYAVCVHALRKVMEVKPDDTYAKNVLTICEEKIGVKAGEPVLEPISRLHDLTQRRIEERVQKEKNDRVAELAKAEHQTQLAAGQPAPYQPVLEAGYDERTKALNEGSSIRSRVARAELFREPLVVFLMVIVIGLALWVLHMSRNTARHQRTD